MRRALHKRSGRAPGRTGGGSRSAECSAPSCGNQAAEMELRSRLCTTPEFLLPRSVTEDDNRAIGDGSNMVFIQYPTDDASKRLTYAGEVDERGWRHGFGLVTWTDGSRYAGEWSVDKPSGYGIQTYADGSFYEGQFLDEQRQGAGAFTPVGSDVQLCGHWTSGELEESRRFLLSSSQAGDGETPTLRKQTAEAVARARNRAQRATDAAWALSLSSRLATVSRTESSGGSQGPIDEGSTDGGATPHDDDDATSNIPEPVRLPPKDDAGVPDSPPDRFPLAQASEEQAAPDATVDAAPIGTSKEAKEARSLPRRVREPETASFLWRQRPFSSHKSLQAFPPALILAEHSRSSLQSEYEVDDDQATPRLNSYLADLRPLTPIANGGRRTLAFALSTDRPASPPAEAQARPRTAAAKEEPAMLTGREASRRESLLDLSSSEDSGAESFVSGHDRDDPANEEGEGSARRSPSNIRSLGATSRQFSRYLEDVRMQDPDDQVLESEAQREARALRVLMQKRRRVWDDWIQLRPPCAATGRRVSRPGVRLKFERDPFAFDNFPKTKLQVETVLAALFDVEVERCEVRRVDWPGLGQMELQVFVDGADGIAAHLAVRRLNQAVLAVAQAAEEQAREAGESPVVHEVSRGNVFKRSSRSLGNGSAEGSGLGGQGSPLAPRTKGALKEEVEKESVEGSSDANQALIAKSVANEGPVRAAHHPLHNPTLALVRADSDPDLWAGRSILGRHERALRAPRETPADMDEKALALTVQTLLKGLAEAAVDFLDVPFEFVEEEKSGVHRGAQGQAPEMIPEERAGDGTAAATAPQEDGVENADSQNIDVTVVLQAGTLVRLMTSSAEGDLVTGSSSAVGMVVGFGRSSGRAGQESSVGQEMREVQVFWEDTGLVSRHLVAILPRKGATEGTDALQDGGQTLEVADSLAGASPEVLDWVVAVGAGAAESSSAVGDHLTGLSGAALAPFEWVLGIHVQAEVGQLVVRREVAAHATGKHAAEAIRRGESQRSGVVVDVQAPRPGQRNVARCLVVWSSTSARGLPLGENNRVEGEGITGEQFLSRVQQEMQVASKGEGHEDKVEKREGPGLLQRASSSFRSLFGRGNSKSGSRAGSRAGSRMGSSALQDTDQRQSEAEDRVVESADKDIGGEGNKDSSGANEDSTGLRVAFLGTQTPSTTAGPTDHPRGFSRGSEPRLSTSASVEKKLRPTSGAEGLREYQESSEGRASSSSLEAAVSQEWVAADELMAMRPAHPRGGALARAWVHLSTQSSTGARAPTSADARLVVGDRVWVEHWVYASPQHWWIVAVSGDGPGVVVQVDDAEEEGAEAHKVEDAGDGARNVAVNKGAATEVVWQRTGARVWFDRSLLRLEQVAMVPARGARGVLNAMQASMARREVGARVRPSGWAIARAPKVLRDSGGGPGTVTWVDATRGSRLVEVVWDWTGTRDIYTGGEGKDAELRGLDAAAEEVVVGEDVDPLVGQRVSLRKHARVLFPRLTRGLESLWFSGVISAVMDLDSSPRARFLVLNSLLAVPAPPRTSSAA